MRILKMTGLAAALAAGAVLAAPVAAQADPPWHRHHGWRGPPPGHYYRPPPRRWYPPPPRAYYYAPPPRVYYAPPPVYYAPPPPVYYGPPGVSLNFRF